ncbi:MAG: hypothetical protein IT442_06785 [Phycisphaeraceae bacterium]|nr:hypothetical protein [Phycisphaeraceae bacterium]
MPSLPLDPDGRLDADIPCVECGYNLRAADPAGRCPECGTPIKRSVPGDLLLLADLTWLARVDSGLDCLMKSAFMITFLAVSLYSVFLLSGDHFNYYDWFNRVFHSGLVLALCLGSLSVLVWLTSPEPLPAKQTPLFSARSVARGLALGVLVLGVLDQSLFIFKLFNPTRRRLDLSIELAHITGISVMSSWLMTAGLLCTRTLALRFHDRKLARWMGILTGAITLVWIGLLFTSIGFLFKGLFLGPVLLLPLAIMILGILSLILAERLGRALRRLLPQFKPSNLHRPRPRSRPRDER